MRYHLYLFLIAAFFIGCATTTDGKSSRGSRYIITAEEIEGTLASATTAFEIVQRLRPGLMERSRMRSAGLGRLNESGTRTLAVDAVYLDGAMFGGLESLQMIPAEGILEIQYLSPFEATTRYGVDTGGGVFLITTK